MSEIALTKARNLQAHAEAIAEAHAELRSEAAQHAESAAASREDRLRELEAELAAQTPENG